MDFVKSYFGKKWTSDQLNTFVPLEKNGDKTKVFNWSEFHFYRSNFLQNPYFSTDIFCNLSYSVENDCHDLLLKKIFRPNLFGSKIELLISMQTNVSFAQKKYRYFSLQRNLEASTCPYKIGGKESFFSELRL